MLSACSFLVSYQILFLNDALLPSICSLLWLRRSRIMTRAMLSGNTFPLCPQVPVLCCSLGFALATSWWKNKYFYMTRVSPVLFFDQFRSAKSRIFSFGCSFFLKVLLSWTWLLGFDRARFSCIFPCSWFIPTISNRFICSRCAFTEDKISSRYVGDELLFFISLFSLKGFLKCIHCG